MNKINAPLLAKKTQHSKLKYHFHLLDLQENQKFNLLAKL